jgi:hypothetical protein
MRPVQVLQTPKTPMIVSAAQPYLAMVLLARIGQVTISISGEGLQ